VGDHAKAGLTETLSALLSGDVNVGVEGAPAGVGMMTVEGLHPTRIFWPFPSSGTNVSRRSRDMLANTFT